MTVPPIPEPDAAGLVAGIAEPTEHAERSMRLGEILIARGKIDAEDLERALELQRERGDKIGKIFVDMGLIAQRDMLAALSDQLGIPLVSVDNPPPSAPEIDSLSHRFLRQCRAFPVELKGLILTLAMADPLDFETVAAVRSFSGLDIQTVLAPEQEILDAIEKQLRRRPSGRPSSRATTTPTPTWNTCATWPAKRRSSAW